MTHDPREDSTQDVWVFLCWVLVWFGFPPCEDLNAYYEEQT